jgi:hypothetical protein
VVAKKHAEKTSHINTEQATRLANKGIAAAKRYRQSRIGDAPKNTEPD